MLPQYSRLGPNKKALHYNNFAHFPTPYYSGGSMIMTRLILLIQKTPAGQGTFS